MRHVVDTVAPTQRSRCHRWLAAFFAFGATMCALTVGLLLFPGSALDSLWRLNPDARLAFDSLGYWSLVLMLTVGIACLFAAIGLWRTKPWGTWLALVILSINMLGDLTNVFVRHDYRGLIGVPVAGTMILVLLASGRRSKGLRSR
jgi:uncharacterized membrane protein (DUF2068 family)